MIQVKASLAYLLLWNGTFVWSRSHNAFFSIYLKIPRGWHQYYFWIIRIYTDGKHFSILYAFAPTPHLNVSSMLHVPVWHQIDWKLLPWTFTALMFLWMWSFLQGYFSNRVKLSILWSLLLIWLRETTLGLGHTLVLTSQWKYGIQLLIQTHGCLCIKRPRHYGRYDYDPNKTMACNNSFMP